jgi:hypothetical protein
MLPADFVRLPIVSTEPAPAPASSDRVMAASWAAGCTCVWWRGSGAERNQRTESETQQNKVEMKMVFRACMRQKSAGAVVGPSGKVGFDEVLFF